jgi:hypothetical protein
VSAMEPTDPATQAALVQVSPPPAPIATVGRMPAAQMLRTTMTRSVPMMVYQLNRIGRSGLAGVALTLFAGIFLFAAVLPQYREISNLREQIREAQRPGSNDPTPHVRLGRFVDGLPKRSELPVIAGRIFTMAASSGVVLEQGRYELTPLHSGHLARYRMSFPIKGSYPDIRRFIDATLSTIPAAALEGLRIERKNVGDAGVSADLRFSIFVRNES